MSRPRHPTTVTAYGRQEGPESLLTPRPFVQRTCFEVSQKKSSCGCALLDHNLWVSKNNWAVLGEQQRNQFLPLDVQVRRYSTENRVECTNSEIGVVRYRDVMLAALLGGKSQMASRLAGDLIAHSFKASRKLMSRDVPRKPHAAIISSRTKCNRMSLGRSVSS